MRKESGFALLLSLFIMLFISLLFGAIFDLLTTDLQITVNLHRETEALYIAEAGLEDAVYNLQLNRDWTSDGLTGVNLPAGSNNHYYVTYPSDPGQIESRGYLGDTGTSKTLRANVVITGSESPYTVRLVTWEE